MSWPKRQRDYDVFAGEVRARLDKGHQEYGDGSWRRHPEALAGEISEELLDVAGWAFILWCRVRELEKRAGG